MRRWAGLLILEDITVTGNDIVVRPKREGIIGTLESMDTAGSLGVTEVMDRSNKWQPICSAVYNFSMRFPVGGKSFRHDNLRFNPIQVAEWLDALLAQKAAGNKSELSQLLGVSRAHVTQFLNLLTLPPETLPRLKRLPSLREHQLRSVVAMPPEQQQSTIRFMLAGSSARPQ